ncbi:D-alanine--D-alanine ligase [bacterium]|nr:D-alanine--D-alanine ligase [bacterium]
MRLTKKSAIAILYGGIGDERSVSFESGNKVFEALVDAGYTTVVKIDVDHFIDEKLRAFSPFVVFNALHGTYGEDGIVQGMLEMMNIPYTGSSVTASAVGMDKILSRLVASDQEIPVARGERVAVTPTLAMPLSPPFVVKEPVNGSSRGITMVDSEDEWKECISHYQEGTTLLVEQKWVGREINVAVLNGVALDDVEIIPAEGFYDFDAKYSRDDTTYLTHCDISESMRRKLYDAAEKMHQFLECRGVTRSDFIVDGDQFVMLEMNTLPGMTAHSLVPMIARKQGISYITLIETLLQEALDGR